MELIIGIITGIRNIRGEMNIAPSLLLDVTVQLQDEKTQEALNQHRDIIINLAGLKTLLVESPGEKPKRTATAVVETATVYVLLEGMIDFAKETNRLEKEISKLTNELTAVSRKLRNEDFLNKAPGNVVDKVKEKQRVLLEKQHKLKANMDKIEELRN